MIEGPTVAKRDIRRHYDLVTPFYRLLWGKHIHHGLWQGDESPTVAQEQMISALIERANIKGGERVLDVGCGMGGSSIHLASQCQCQVTGITLSPVQRWWAAMSARWQGVGKRTTFLCADAEQVEFPDQSFDVVWSIECTEHLFDKTRFFQRAARWLRPGGRLAICVWLAGGDELDLDLQQQVSEVCAGMLCPSLGSLNDHRRWLTDAGLSFCSFDDWTERIVRTWEICLQRVDRSRLRYVAPTIRQIGPFLDSFDSILRAYRSGAMQYGCLVFESPVEPRNDLSHKLDLPANKGLLTGEMRV